MGAARWIGRGPSTHVRTRQAWLRGDPIPPYGKARPDGTGWWWGLTLGTILATGLAVPAPTAAQAIPRASACVRCHLTLKDERLVAPARDFPNDIHAQRGFDCLDCHGRASGGANLDPARGFLDRPARRDIPQLCGRCHSDAEFMKRYNPSLRVDQVDEYWTSVHGHRLREFNDSNVATCINCHPAHNIRPPTDPESSVYPTKVAETCGACHADTVRMRGYGIPTDQLEAYRHGIHGQLLFDKGDLSAPTCNDCHGNHGATPPGVSSVRNVCGQCHATVAELFQQNGHSDRFTAAGLPGCVTCHSNHDIALPADSDLAVRARAVCARCHAEGDQHGGEFLAMLQLIDSLETGEASARATLVEAENAGMEVTQPQFELEDVTNALTKARTAIHSFRVQPVRDEIEAGLKITDAAHRRGVAAMAEHHFRRVGLGVSVIIIAALIAAILGKLREIEKRTPPGHLPDSH